MSDAGESFTCPNCGRHVAGEAPDRNGWCKECRRLVLRRSANWAVFPAVLVAALFFWLLAWFGMYASAFLIVWLALGLGLAWVAFKVARRVIFEVIRNRGVQPPS